MFLQSTLPCLTKNISAPFHKQTWSEAATFIFFFKYILECECRGSKCMWMFGPVWPDRCDNSHELLGEKRADLWHGAAPPDGHISLHTPPWDPPLLPVGRSSPASSQPVGMSDCRVLRVSVRQHGIGHGVFGGNVRRFITHDRGMWISASLHLSPTPHPPIPSPHRQQTTASVVVMSPNSLTPGLCYFSGMAKDTRH